MVNSLPSVGESLSDGINCDLTIKKIATGGFGWVAMGPDKNHRGQWRALKTLQPQLFTTSDIRDLFVREALTWINLWPHSNVVQAYSIDTINELPFINIEYASGGSLRDRLRQHLGNIPLKLALLWAQQIAAGLSYLHEPAPEFLRFSPIVHRDLKPENVLLNKDDRALITDFGLAKVVEAGAMLRLHPSLKQMGLQHEEREDALEQPERLRFHRTEAGVGLGSVAYMAPEQWLNAAKAGPAADIYALGLILSELLANRHALLDTRTPHTHAEWFSAHTQMAPVRLREVNSKISPTLEDLYQACLAKSPAARPTARQALEVLQLEATTSGAKKYVPWEIYPRQNYHIETYWHNSSVAYRQFGFYNEALERNEKALDLNRQNKRIWLTRGNILFEMGRFEEAIDALSTSLALRSPRDHVGREQVLNSLGNALTTAERYEEADQAYEQALSRVTNPPLSARTWYSRARNLLLWGTREADAGRVVEARSHIAQAIKYAEQSLRLKSDFGPSIQILPVAYEILVQLSN